jgi:hypothetical protein
MCIYFGIVGPSRAGPANAYDTLTYITGIAKAMAGGREFLTDLILPVSFEREQHIRVGT